VSLDDWILAMHLLSAFALVGALVMFSIAIVSVRNADRPSQAIAIAPVVKVGNIAVSIGILGTIVFGIWLAISLDRYSIFDFWVIAALVLWAIGAETGRRSGAEYDRAFARARELAAAGKADEPSPEFATEIHSRRGGLLHLIATVAIALILVDMIWKPGA
jgi:hypothetical protein